MTRNIAVPCAGTMAPISPDEMTACLVHRLRTR